MSFAMICNGKRRAVKVLHGVAALTLVLIRRGSKLSVVSVFVTVLARGEFHFVNRIFARGKMAFRTFHARMFPEERVAGIRMFLHAKE